MLPCPASELEKRSRSKSDVHAIVEPYKMDVFQTPTKEWLHTYDLMHGTD